MKRRESPPPPGTISALIEELARAPERDFREAWDRGLRAGDLVGEKFEIQRELGRGGFGIVFEAHDRDLDRQVALKAIRPGPREGSPAREQLLRREANAVSQLQHRNIVTLHEYGRCPTGAYLVFELLRGETLASRIARGPLPVGEAIRVGIDVASALVHAHAHGVLHRDLKPGNVFLADDGDPKLLDFGLAQVLGAGGPARSGTPGYMAPEQLRGEPEDVRTDVFAVGVLLHEMLTGRRLFPDSSIPDAAAAVRDAPRLEATGAPPALAHVIARMLEPDPVRRPRDASEVLRALVAVQRSLTPRSRLSRWRAVVASVALGLSTGLQAQLPQVTVDQEAYGHYFAGHACAKRPIVSEDCGAEFRSAIALDPGFALAHYELAVWSYWNGGSPVEQRTAIGHAVAHADRAPEKERILIHAWSAYLGGRLDEALDHYRKVTRRWREDPHAWLQIADILRRRDEHGAEIAALERATEADPDSPWAVGYLAECLGARGRLDLLREKVRAWEADPRPATLHALSIGYGWLGDLRKAADAAARNESLGVGLLAKQDLLGAVVFAGEYAAAEPGLHALASRGSSARALGWYGLAALDGYRGRRRSGLEALDALRREHRTIESDSLYHTLRIDYLLGGAAAGEVWAAIETLRAIDPSGASEHAPALAWLGDLEHARELASIRPGSTYARTYEGIAAWRRGDVDGALERLRELSRAGPCATWRIPPVYFLAEVAAAAGRDAEAIDAIRRFHAMYVPLTMWRSWAYPRSLFLLARSQERLGQADRARETLDRLLALWGSADPEEPLLAEARRARASLGKPKG